MTKNVLITGGSRGIGLGIAKELAQMGCNLAINGRKDKEKVIHILEELSSFGTKVIYCKGDISSSSDRAEILKSVLDKFNQIHVLINNAGVGPLQRNDVLNTTEESYDRVMGINLRGPFFLTQKVAKHMVENVDQGENVQRCIINMSSVSATMASISRGEYCMSKAGMGMMTKLFASMLGEHKIPVYEVRPGIIETDMTAGVLEKYQKMVDNGLNVQPRLGFTEDVAKAVSALVDDKFLYSSGQVIMVDGGLALPRL